MRMWKILIGLLVLLSIMSCSPKSPSPFANSDQPAAKQVVQLSDQDCIYKLENASSIKIQSAFFSLGRSDTIYADGVEVASVKGQYFTTFGDTFVLATINGTPILAEKEIKRGFRFSAERLAVMSDPSGQEVGFIAQNRWQDPFSWGYVFHVFDASQNEIGQTRQAFSTFLKQTDIAGMSSGQLAMEYQVKQQWGLTSTYDIMVKEGPKAIKPEVAIFLVCIEDAIEAAQDHKSSSSSAFRSSSSSSSSGFSSGRSSTTTTRITTSRSLSGGRTIITTTTKTRKR